MIHVVAVITTKPGKRAEFLAAYHANVPVVRAEAGCIEYGPAIDAETDIPIQFKLGADRMVVIEKWETVAALKAHGVAPHMQAYRAKVKDYVRGMELRVLAPA